MQSEQAPGPVTRATGRAGFGKPKDPEGQQGQRGDRQGGHRGKDRHTPYLEEMGLGGVKVYAGLDYEVTE